MFCLSQNSASVNMKRLGRTPKKVSLNYLNYIELFLNVFMFTRKESKKYCVNYCVSDENSKKEDRKVEKERKGVVTERG
uniref:SPK domain-containing protein n=1 Tax=Caenorhabditis tropicalis TaxID=1561998 RepID=A0A1I7T8V4_9PELO